MKIPGKKALSILLALILLLSLIPPAFADDDGAGQLSAAEPEEEEGSIALVPSSAEPPASASLPDPAEPEPVSLSFVCEPASALVTVFDPSCPDLEGRPSAVPAGEDGCYLLLPGSYLFSASCPGYETVEETPFLLEPGAGRVIRLSLVPDALLPMPAREDRPLYDSAYPLPALTGDEAYDTANIARSQLGYTMNGGTVYGAWWTGVTNWGLDYTYLDWCAMFACWCADQAGAGMNMAFNKNGASCRLLLEWQQAHACADTECATLPRTGDFLYFAGSDGTASHTAIVTSYDASGNTVHFIGGNQGSPSAVRVGSVAWEKGAYFGAKTLIGYGRPNYSIQVQEEDFPRITADPSNVTVNVGELALFTVSASGTDLRYRWQWRKGSGGEWQDSSLSGSDTAGLTVPAVLSRSGHQYRCQVFNDKGQTVSTAAVLTVTDKPVITRQPQSATASPGTTVCFRVTALGTNLRYQWQWRTGPDGTWKSSTLPGSETAALSVSAQSFRSGYQYRCYIVNDNASVMSAAATLTVDARPVVTAQPRSLTVPLGETARFTVSADRAAAFRWQWSRDGGATWNNSSSATAGYNTATLQVTASASRDGYRYRCLVSNSAGTAISEAAVLTVDARPVVTAQPRSLTADLGSTALFSVAASRASDYQWQWSKNGGKSWSNSSSATAGYNTATLQVTASASRDGYRYRCLVSNSAGTAISEAAVLTVDARPLVTVQPRDLSVPAGETAVFTVSASRATAYCWQWSKDGGVTWNDSSSVTPGYDTASLQVPARPARSGYLYRCRVSNAYGSRFSEPAALTVR